MFEMNGRIRSCQRNCLPAGSGYVGLPQSCTAHGQVFLYVLAYIANPLPISFRLDKHLTDCACRRAELSDGSRMPISTAMMPMTTSNSTNVNARRRDDGREHMSAILAPRPE